MPLSARLTVDGLMLGMSRSEVVGHLGPPTGTSWDGQDELIRYDGRVLVLRSGRLVQLQGGGVLCLSGQEAGRRGDPRGEMVARLGQPDREEELDVTRELRCAFYEARHQVLMVAFDNYRVCSFVLLPLPGGGEGGSAVPLRPQPQRGSPGNASRRREPEQ